MLDPECCDRDKRWRSWSLHPVAQTNATLAHPPHDVGYKNDTIITRAEDRIHTERAVGGVHFIW
jgi:hypothetical protein